MEDAKSDFIKRFWTNAFDYNVDELIEIIMTNKAYVGFERIKERWRKQLKYAYSRDIQFHLEPQQGDF